MALYGDSKANPYIVACLTSECEVRFGSYGHRAAAYDDFAIRLSAKGWIAPLIAHEWSHAEVYRRVGGWWRARNIPRWFDEGLAVALANEPLHSENNWQEVLSQGLPRPRLEELVSFSDWGTAVRKYGETAGDVPANRHVVYTTAGQEARAFLSCAGIAGVAGLLNALRERASFENECAHAKSNCVN